MSPRTDTEIVYAVRAGVVVHVSEVARGLACNCVCAGCGEALVARKGEHRGHHFAHLGETRCTGGAETLLHRLAKEIISQAPVLALPAYTYRAGPPVPIAREVLPPSRLRIDSTAVEQSLGPIIPDLTLCSGPSLLLVEIVVSHPVDRAKLRHVRRLGFPLLEIRLSAEHLLLARHALTKRLIEDPAIKRWLFHPQQRVAEAEWVRACRQAIAAARVLARTRGSGCTAPAAALAWRPARAPSSTYSRTAAAWNAWAESFHRTRGRYPSAEETRLRAAALRDASVDSQRDAKTPGGRARTVAR